MQEVHRQYHPVSNLFPLMQGADFEALKQDIGEHGQHEPIWLHQDGSIIDGRNRHRACIELGIEPQFRTWDGGDSLVSFVVSLNLHRRHLSESQRAMVAAKLATMQHGGDRKSDQDANLHLDRVSRTEAADLLQVSPRSVANARVVYTDGAPELVAAVERGDVAVSAAAEVATLPAEWQDVIVSNGDVTEAARDMRQGHRDKVEERVRPHVANNSGNNEWYTPLEFIEAARNVMGGIDLDPASSEAANEVVQATAYYTAEDDGLSLPWAGRVWLNPPYADDLIGKFANKLVAHFECVDVTEAIVLVNNATETRWFRQLISVASAVVFPGSRVRFWRPDGKTSGPLQGQAVIYLGEQPETFKSVFGLMGWGATL